MEELGAMGIQRIMVEGGGTLIGGLIRAGLVDEIYAYIGNIIIGGKDAPTLADGEGFISESEFCPAHFARGPEIRDGPAPALERGPRAVTGDRIHPCSGPGKLFFTPNDAPLLRHQSRRA